LDVDIIAGEQIKLSNLNIFSVEQLKILQEYSISSAEQFVGIYRQTSPSCYPSPQNFRRRLVRVSRVKKVSRTERSIIQGGNISIASD
jgi:hypothetical protein